MIKKSQKQKNVMQIVEHVVDLLLIVFHVMVIRFCMKTNVWNNVQMATLRMEINVLNVTGHWNLC